MTTSHTPPAWDAIDVADWAAEETDDEPMGTKEKFWVTDETDHPWLFKFAREHHGVVRGEDWAEWIVHHLAELIGIPTATVRPALCGGRRGIVSRSVVAPAERLVHGNELLRESSPAYDPQIQRENPGYTVAAVHEALHGVDAPRSRAELAGFGGFEVWAAYLLLDAWVAGRDRHHENWAIIREGSGRWLAPSFDHGNAVGFQVPPAEAEALSRDRDRLLAWAAKGRSHHFAERPSLVTLAGQALELAGEAPGSRWKIALANVDTASVRAVVHAVPGELMSESARNFCVRLLDLNRRRLLDGD